MPDESITTPAAAYVPPAVVQYLGSEESVNINLEILKLYELKDPDMSFIFELLWDVIERRKTPKAVIVELRGHFKRWDANRVNNLAIELLGKKLLPLSNLIPGVEQELQDLGGKLENFSSKKVTLPAVTVEELVTNMIQDLQIQLADKFLKHRLENIVTSKIKGIRDDFETKNRMIRGIKIGGLDIAPTQADQVIRYIDSAKESIKIIEEKPHVPGTVPEEPPKPVEKKGPEVPESIIKKETGRSDAFTVRLEDIEEIKAEEAKEISTEVLKEYNRVEKEIISESGYSFSDPDTQKRFESAIQARVRDVRDELETKNLLTRGPKEGGLGLSPDKANALIELINKKNTPLKDRLAKIEEEKKTDILERKKRQQEIEKTHEKEDLDTRFAKLTGRTPSVLPEEEEKKPEISLPLKEERFVPKHKLEKAWPPKPAAAEPIPPAPAKPIPVEPAPKPVEAKPVEVKAPRIAPPPPATAVPAIKPTAAIKEAPKPPFVKPPEGRPALPKAKVRVSPPSIKPQPAAKPKVEEIKFERRLSGPIEELRQMRLEDFRRLSKDPKERAIKIKDKIDLLEEESFDKRMKGVAAWQESPVNRVYLDLIQAAFQTGKNIQTIISEREAQGRQTLSWEEFQSILEINQKLKE